ncbi:hypothetical protein [Endozoicomonas sp. 8E]|uniref:hypothetical protein n=1 Tax=Endozoicomonas sp. 8E TaxID=3035692 RepID=UPI002938F19E|nr:hypothetical protein [Endozoicomonas sp. 8E]WOG27038.1 hypothetical protein P6910_21175 [Endozoicomonas sp. 8E]
MAGCFNAELEQNPVSTRQNFYIKSDRRTFSEDPTEVARTNAYAGSDSLPDDKRHRPFGCELKTTIIESISWQWLYTTNLLVAYELILITRDTPRYSKPYSWLPLEALIAVGLLLKNYWHPDSPLFNLVELQAAFMLTPGNRPSATISTMFGSEHNPTQYQPPGPNGQKAPQATTSANGYFTHSIYFDSGNGNESPEQRSHTLDLTCFVHPCHGVCRLRTSFDSRESTQWPLNDAQMLENIHLTTEDLILINGLLNLGNHNLHDETGMPHTLAHALTPMGTSETQQTTGSFQSDHKTGQHVCDRTVVSQDGRQRPCGMISKNAKTLSSHKSRYHTGQKTCDLTVVGDDGRQQLCGKVFKNAASLSSHKGGHHTDKKICDVAVAGENGQQRPCERLCKSVQALFDHKRRNHTGQQTCNMTIIEDDGQQRSCRKVCKSSKSLSNHKNREHSGQKTCNMTMVEEDGQQRPCGKICKNAPSLSVHKSKYHSGQKTCYITLVTEDGLQRLCGKVCKNTQALSAHKRMHQKRKSVDTEQDNDLSLQKSKVNK